MSCDSCQRVLLSQTSNLLISTSGYATEALRIEAELLSFIHVVDVEGRKNINSFSIEYQF